MSGRILARVTRNMLEESGERRRIAIVGPGKVGATLGRALAERGYRIAAIVGRDPARTALARDFIGATRVANDPRQAVRGAEIVLIAVPDGAIREVVRSLVGAQFEERAIVAHTSGYHSSADLEPLRSSRGSLALASAHPLQSFARPEEAIRRLSGVAWALEGDSRALEVLEGIVVELGGRPIAIETGAKALYHAAAAVASNFLVTLVDAAIELAGAAGFPREAALDALAPLVEGTVANVKRLGPALALTGPIVRGDSAVVAGHLAAIDARVPRLADLYRTLARRTLDLALARDSFPRSAAPELERLLGQRRGARGE